MSIEYIPQKYVFFSSIPQLKKSLLHIPYNNMYSLPFRHMLPLTRLKLYEWQGFYVIVKGLGLVWERHTLTADNWQPASQSEASTQKQDYGL